VFWRILRARERQILLIVAEATNHNVEAQGGPPVGLGMITEAGEISEGPDEGRMSRKETAPKGLREEGRMSQVGQAVTGYFVNRTQVASSTGVLKGKAREAGPQVRGNGKVVAVATRLTHSNWMFPNSVAILFLDDPLPVVWT